jgi:broad specificity phosphatase PhoE
MRLYLITHAATQLDPTTAVERWSLSAAGATQAVTLATLPFWDEVDQIALSREDKTRLTVAPLLATRAIPVTVDARFDELQRPGWVADYGARVQQAFADPAHPAGDWEPAAVALARLQAGIADLFQHYANQTVALVGHGLTLSLYRAHLLGQDRVDFADWRRLSFAAVALVDVQQGQLLQDFVAVAGDLPRG